MIFNVSMKIEHLLENENAVRVFDTFLPGMKKMVQANPQALKLSVEQMVKYSRIPNAAELLEKIDQELNKLNTPENMISASEAKLIEQFKVIDAEEKAAEAKPETHHQDAVYPGQVWLDTTGERIQAHGGAVIYENGTYYWYGENKKYTDGKNGIWTWGLNIYSSKDLCNWKHEGYLIPPVLDDPNSAMFPTKRVDRPHIVKNEKTGKYVCWIKLSGPEAAFTIWQSDSLIGGYEMVENLYNPGGYKIGDFDLIADKESGNAYIYFDADHKSTVCMKLTDDYLHADCEVSRSYENLMPPFTREAQSLFEANGRKYMITSSMSGYVPNRSDCAVSDSWESVFRSIGDPHVNDDSCASFNSQISKVFKVEGTDDLHIAMADRWLSDYHVDARIADLFIRVIGSAYDPERYQATDEEKREMYAANKLESANTSVADYVWLPLIIKAPTEADPDGSVKIEWKDSWSL